VQSARTIPWLKLFNWDNGVKARRTERRENRQRLKTVCWSNFVTVLFLNFQPGEKPGEQQRKGERKLSNEKTVVAVNLGSQQVKDLKNLATSRDVSVSSIVRETIDQALSQIKDQAAEINAEIQSKQEAWITEFKKNTFPQDFEIIFQIPTRDMIVEPINPEEGKWTWRALCSDCKDEKEGLFFGDLERMAKSVFDNVERHRVFDDTLDDSRRAIRYNHIYEDTHRHPRIHKLEDVRPAENSPVDSYLKVEVSLRGPIREELDRSHLQIYRECRKLKRKLETLGLPIGSSEGFEEETDHE
jgi:hypothetical protein